MIIYLLAPAQATGDIVRFQTRIGAGTGRWQGPSPQPADVHVDVELDFREVVDWNTAELSSAPSVIQIQATGTLLRGRVTHFSNDGVLGLQLGDGSIQLDMQGEPPPDVLHHALAVILPAIDIYPTGI
jgi:hypothetical protein